VGHCKDALQAQLKDIRLSCRGSVDVLRRRLHDFVAANDLNGHLNKYSGPMFRCHR